LKSRIHLNMLNVAVATLAISFIIRGMSVWFKAEGFVLSVRIGRVWNSTQYGVPCLKSPHFTFTTMHLRHCKVSLTSYWVVDTPSSRKSLHSNHRVKEIQTLYLILSQLTRSQSSHSISLQSVLILTKVVKWTNSQLYLFFRIQLFNVKNTHPLLQTFHTHTHTHSQK
jgi:hypothetical protein